MAAKIIVGFTTQVRSDKLVEELMPEFAPRGGTTDDVKKAKQVADKKQAYMDDASAQPYTGTFGHVVLSDPGNEEIKSWEIKGRWPVGTKPPISVMVANWLLKKYPDAWSADVIDRPTPEVVFIGFDTRMFLKMLGIECSLPEIQTTFGVQPLPPGLWYGNSAHRDIADAICPKDFKSLSLSTALKMRRPFSDERAQANWDGVLARWSEPHKNAEDDVYLAAELSAQLGFLS